MSGSETVDVHSENRLEHGLRSRIRGALLGSAVGDAIGGATEGWLPEQIKSRWNGWVLGIERPYHGDDWKTARPMSPLHKGDGHITDDTLMTHLLIDVYDEVRRHLTAFDVADHLVPRMLEKIMWVPEKEAHEVLFHRLFVAEKYVALRLKWGSVDPREAGVGNAVNCGAAMYISPVGLVNVGLPASAYAEAIDIAGAHQSSFGREAAGVLAAAVAAAASEGASVSSVVDTALSVAKDGTRQAIESVVEAASAVGDWIEAIETNVLRNAMRPFDTLGDLYREPGLGARRPSRIHAIEELPIALGALVVAQGSVRDAVLLGTNYGRDSDSIASMAGGLAGALNGESGVPRDWVAHVSEASRVDLHAPAEVMCEVTRAIRESDLVSSLEEVETSRQVLRALKS